MPVQLHEVLDGKVMEVTVSGTLTKDDYIKTVPEFERLVQKHARISLLIVMKDFHGWDLAALWQDIKFDAKHFSDIKRIAMVGDKKWEKAMATVCVPFTGATVKYYDMPQLEQARMWILEGETIPAPV